MTLLDSHSFNLRFKESYSKTRNYIKSLCHNSTEADDIAQDTFVRAYRFYHQFDHRSSFDAWVMQIARNQYLDSIRRTKSRVQTFSFDDSHPESYDARFIDPTPSPEHQIVRREVDPILVSAVSGLTESQQQLIRWIIVEQRSYMEVAHLLNIPLGTVKSRYGRALREARGTARQMRAPQSVTGTSLSCGVAA